MDAEIQKKLREKFDTRVIGMKPTIWCRACRDAIKNRKFTCDQHDRKRCKPSPDGCGQNITEAHLHIEFVSHAEVTDRLLEVDPAWSWEPVAFGPDGLPALTREGGLWIRLTVAGVTRIGYGGCDNKQGDDAIKEAVSDAIKTTAMRFGVALDLWRKSEESGKSANDLAARQEHGQQPRNGAQNSHQNGHQGNGATRRPSPPPADEPTPEPPADGPNPAAFDVIKAAVSKHGWDKDKVADRYTSQFGEPIEQVKSVPRASAFVKLIEGDPSFAAAPAASGAAQ